MVGEFDMHPKMENKCNDEGIASYRCMERKVPFHWEIIPIIHCHIQYIPG